MATSRKASRRPTSSSSAASRPRRRTRAISSPMPASPASARMARASSGSAPRATSWCATPAPPCSAWTCRSCASPPSEIGGGFGGKTTVFIEPVALALSRKANRPVKMVMSREEVFRPPAPPPPAAWTSRSASRRTAASPPAWADSRLPGRRLRRLAGRHGRHVRLCLLRPRERARPSATTSSPTGRSWPPTARPSAPMVAFAVESVLDELAQEDRHGLRSTSA